MKFIASGVAICAGMTRSPSFSRSSSSTRMNMRPFFASSMISSGVERKPWRSRAGSAFSAVMTQLLHPSQIAGKDIDLDMDGTADADPVEGGDGGGMGNDVQDDVHGIGHIFDLIDGERD